ncbi:MAG: PHP domain-containing protein [Dehalococcoidia bacterium]|nr:MAG: PHP domain-containing protein [Dehalococcoidia bacterium]
MKYDLHLHTTGSDGRLTPTELVRLARTRGLEVIAVTDHDSVGGVKEALEEASRVPQITIIPGVEINTDLPTGELHVLGYFIDYTDKDLLVSLGKIRESRVGRAEKMVDKLHGLGLSVEWQRIMDLARGDSICRTHIAQAMLEKGYVSSEKEAFDKYIGRNGPAYVERDKVKPVDAVRIIKRAGGLPVLAHPADIQDLDAMLKELMEAGLIGMETYYGQYDSATIERLAGIADQYKLLKTGGTDYHHFQDEQEVPMGSVDIPDECIRKLFSAAGKKYEPK